MKSALVKYRPARGWVPSTVQSTLSDTRAQNSGWVLTFCNLEKSSIRSSRLPVICAFLPSLARPLRSPVEKRKEHCEALYERRCRVFGTPCGGAIRRYAD